MDPGTTQPVYRFGPYILDAGRLVLERDGVLIPTTPRVLSALLLLVENAGRTVSKEEMLTALWPGRYAEEANLSQAISGVRKALALKGGGADLIRTLPGQGYRFTGDVLAAGEPRGLASTPPPKGPLGLETERLRRSSVRTGAGGLLAAAAALIALLAWMASRPAKPLLAADRTGVVLADLQNFTGDHDFDHVVRRVAEVDLSQSPLLQVTSESRVAEALDLMGQPKDAALTPAAARAVCERLNGGAVIQPVISSLGRRYVLVLSATGCVDGRSLAEEKGEAVGKEQVAGAIDALSARLRRRLGESQGSIAKLNVPIAPGRTASFDALLAYSEGTWLHGRGEIAAAAAAFQRAVDLDPQFADAWLGLGQQYYNLKQPEKASQATTRAYELRGSTSQRMGLLISSRYNMDVTKDLYASLSASTLMAQLYPNDVSAWGNLSNLQNWLGQFDEAVTSGRRTLALDPKHLGAYSVLARALNHDGQTAEAIRIDRMAMAAGVAAGDTRGQLIADLYLTGHFAESQKLTVQAAGTPLERDAVIEASDIAVARGRMREAEALHDRAEMLGRPRGLHLSFEAHAEEAAALGLATEARRQLDQVPPELRTDDYHIAASQVYAPARVEADLARDLARWPHDTLLIEQFAPIARATLAMRRGDGRGAVRALAAAAGLAHRTLDVPYLLGKALLMAGDAPGAAAQFRWVLAHEGLGPDPKFDLAHLQLARALRTMGDAPGSRGEYVRFLDAWKDADPNLPELVAAKAELARLGG